jgi:hypothetical protein
MCNEIMKSQTDNSFAIVVNSCGTCPFVQALHCGKEYVCNHPSRVVAKPYARDRKVEAHIIDANCILNPVKEPVKICSERLCNMNAGVCFECEAYSEKR